ncbi:hypothetical protein B484DRAFT_483363, partial [Ochromonadaceae sp. CCMP2298]
MAQQQQQLLSAEVHAEVFSRVKSSFSDFHLFDFLVAEKLKKAITDSNSIEINMKTTKRLAERYFDVDKFKTAEQKMVLAQIQLIFRSAYVLLLSHQEAPRAMFMHSTAELLSKFPQFKTLAVDQEELGLLLNFRNMCKVALLVIPARLNKQCIIKIAGRLEGSQNEYITGGGQKPAVSRRVEIYEAEGGISAEKRPDRVRPRRAADDHILSSKRSNCSFSEKRVKLIRLPTDEMQNLSK